MNSPDALLPVLDQLDSQDEMLRRARESLDETLADLKLTPAEESALASELSQLRGLADKLDTTTLEIAAFGMVSRGKSSILNALMGGPATMGALVAATGLEQSNLSRHVAALERAHCVRREPRGREVLVTVADPDLHALCALVCRRLPPR